MPRKKSKRLKALEEKLKIVKKELARRKKAQNVSTPSKSKRGRKSMKSIFEECVALLEKVKKMQYSKAFLQPVDWKALNIPTYPQIIKHPMDLKTVQIKLNNASYHTPYHFARDMRLIYQNATTFNKPTTPYYVAATKLAKKFEEEFERKIVDFHENNEFTRKISKVITSLIRRDDSIPFRAPVNPQVLEIPDYLDVIDTPMDLGTILNKINYYTQFKHFVHDLFLVWDNCCRYNPKQNQIHQTALKLREYTQKQLNRFCQADFQMWQEDDAATPPAYSASSLSMNMSDNKENNNTSSDTQITPTTINNESQSQLRQLEMEMQQEHPHEHEEVEMEEEDDEEEEVEDVTSEADMHIFKLCDEMEDEEESNRMMISYLFAKQELDQSVIGHLDFGQKEELQRGIQCLDSDHFDPLINMLQSFIPEGEGDDDEVELDVDSIDDPLQVKMYNYMLRAIHQQENERIKREGGKVNVVQVLAHDQVNLKQDSMDGDINDIIGDMGDIGDGDIKMMDNDNNNNNEHITSPNVVNAFPIDNCNNNMQMNEDRDGDGDGDVDVDVDEDIDMMNNEDDNEDININGDIVSDIANVIECMPVVGVGGNDNDVGEDVGVEMEEQGNDNDVTDTEIMEINEQLEEEQEQEEEEEHEDNIKENGEEVLEENMNMNIPTMPVLQTVNDDNDNDNDNELENEDDVKQENEENYEDQSQLLADNTCNNEEMVMDNDNMNDEIVTKIENENENMNMNMNMNELLNENNLNVNDGLGQIEQNEDDDVDTPLADEIEF